MKIKTIGNTLQTKNMNERNSEQMTNINKYRLKSIPTAYRLKALESYAIQNAIEAANLKCAVRNKIEL